jgi:hypothetical protein
MLPVISPAREAGQEASTASFDPPTRAFPLLTSASGASTKRFAVTKKHAHAPRAALVEVAQALTRKLYGPTEQLERITIRLKSGIRIRVDVPEGGFLNPPSGSHHASSVSPDRFVPTPFQKGILQALNGQALRTDDLAHKVGNRRKLFIHPGGLRELQDQSLVAHHKRLGYYRPDAPPPVLKDAEEIPG